MVRESGAVLCPNHRTWIGSGLGVLAPEAACGHWDVRGRGGPVFPHFPASSTELHNISPWTFGVSVWRRLVRSLWVSRKGRAECQREEVGGRGG